MEFHGKIEGGKVTFAPSVAVTFANWKQRHEGTRILITEDKDGHGGSPRTEQQNRALHLYCQQVADALNEGGLKIEQILKSFTMELEWNKDTVKEILWRTAQKRLLGKASTTDLNKQEDVSKVYDAVNRFLAQVGVHVPFPSYEPGYWETAPLKKPEV